jgi:hypothetical protein
VGLGGGNNSCNFIGMYTFIHSFKGIRHFMILIALQNIMNEIKF